MTIRSVHGLSHIHLLRHFKLSRRLAVAMVFLAVIVLLSRWIYRTRSLPSRSNLDPYRTATIFAMQASAAGFGDIHPSYQSAHVVRRTATHRGEPPVA
jgi:hypothetical protein